MIAQRTTVRRIAVGVAVAATLATSACAAGQRAETAEELPTLDGTNANVGQIALRGLAVVTPDGATYARGTNPQLRLVLVNNSDSTDQLVKISSSAATGWGSFANSLVLDDDASASATPASSPTDTALPTSGAPTVGTASSAPTSAAPTSSAPQADKPVTLPRGVAVSFGVPAAEGRVLALLGSTRTLYPGGSVAITFTFAKAGSKTIQVPIEISDAGSFTPSPSYVPGETASEGAAQQEEGS